MKANNIVHWNDLTDGLADLRAADQMSPIQDFHQLKHSSNIETAYSVQIFDRMLCLKPATCPARLAYARVFQQRGACKSTVEQYEEELEDLQWLQSLGMGMMTMQSRLCITSAMCMSRCSSCSDSNGSSLCYGS